MKMIAKKPMPKHVAKTIASNIKNQINQHQVDTAPKFEEESKILKNSQEYRDYMKAKEDYEIFMEDYDKKSSAYQGLVKSLTGKHYGNVRVDLDQNIYYYNFALINARNGTK